MIRWGRKGLLVGALAVSFVTPVSQTTSIKQLPSAHKVEVRHVTQARTGSSIKQVNVTPNNRVETRHVTPTELVGGIKRVTPDYQIKVRHVTPTDAVVEVVKRGGRADDYNPDDFIMMLIKEFLEVNG